MRPFRLLSWRAAPWVFVFLGLHAGVSAAFADTNASVVALGKLRPGGGVARIAAPYSLQGPSVIGELLVEVGARVTNGQVLARTHNFASLAGSVAESQADVAVRRARLALVESGQKPGEIAALAANAEEERANFSEAVQSLSRIQRLHQQSIASSQELDSAQTRCLAASNRVLAATQRLAAGAEVRSVEVSLARAELAFAEAAAERSRQEFELTQIRAPFAGEVLSIHARPGELAADGLLDLGRTDSMEVLAEVYESDIRHVSRGQSAQVRGDVLDGELAARVTEIGRQVRPNKLLNPDPAAFADNRVIEVTLGLVDSRRVSALSGALVQVRFLP